MKIVTCALLPSCFAVSPAIAGDSRGMLRDCVHFGGQFVIEEPDTTLLRDFFGDDCCLNSQMRHCPASLQPPGCARLRVLNPKGEVPGNQR
jgi:hypothetical protein